MNAHPGYYAVVQYCPDRGRAEAVNIGVALFVPARGFLEAKLTHSTRRVQRVFGRGAVDAWWLKTVRNLFERRLKAEHAAGRFSEPADLDSYFAALGNDVIATPTRATRVEDPAAELERLCRELVSTEGEDSVAVGSPVSAILDKTFRELQAQMREVDFGGRYQIAGYTHRIRADYRYINGVNNLVRLLPVGRNAGRTVTEGIRLGGESQVVARQLQIENRPSRLVVVAAPLSTATSVAQSESELARVFRNFEEAQFVASKDVQQFAARVAAEAH